MLSLPVPHAGKTSSGSLLQAAGSWLSPHFWNLQLVSSLNFAAMSLLILVLFFPTQRQQGLVRA